MANGAHPVVELGLKLASTEGTTQIVLIIVSFAHELFLTISLIVYVPGLL